MAIDEKVFTEEIDLFITQAENDAKVEPEPETAAESGSPGDTELDGESNDLPSESGQEGSGPEVVSGDPEPGDTIPEAHEDGAEGGTVEAEGGKPAEPAATAISDAALTLAVQAGISIEDARQFPSDAVLAGVVGRITDAELARRSTSEQHGQELREPDVDLIAAIPDLDPEKYDEKTVEMFAAMKGALKSQQDMIQSLHESHDATAAASQEAVDRDIMRWFDDEINSLPFEATLGSGGRGDQALGSSQLAKRDEIAKQCAVLMAGYRESGHPSPTREEIFRTSARLVLAEEYQSLHDEEVSASLKKRAGQHIERAGGSKNKQTQSPADEIAAMLDEKYPASG